MKLPKISDDPGVTVTAVLVLLVLIVGIVYLKKEVFSSLSTPVVTVDVPQTAADTYSITATALIPNPSNQYSTTTDAETAAAYSLQDGSEIWSWNDGKQWPIASLTKLMTAIIATDLISPNQRIVIEPADEQYLIDATASPTFRAGDVLTSKDLVTSMLVVSSDDAAETLADYYGRDKFIQAMNDMARNIGMDETNFVSPSGLSAQNLSTTADLYKLVSFIWSRDPSFFATTRETKAAVTVYGATGKAAPLLV